MRLSFRECYLALGLLILILITVFVQQYPVFLPPAQIHAAEILVTKLTPLGTSASTPISAATTVGTSTSTPTPVATSHVQSLQTTQAPSCCDISKGVDVEPFCNGSDTLSLKGCKCVDVLLCRMVAVTSLASNHFAEAQDNFGSLQKYFPHLKIIVYDIGLTESDRNQLVTYCNVEVRNFPFDKYPDHVRNLGTYAFKPLAVSEVAREYDVILYGDSSVRMKSSDMATVLKSIVKFPFVSGSPHWPAIVSLTHDGMLEYLHMKQSRRELVNFVGTQAGVWLMWANSLMKKRVINAWVDCALNKRCIAPEGALVGPCNLNDWGSLNVGNYVGCHRFDQSALNMIFAREFGIPITTQIANWNLAETMWNVDRRATSKFKIHKKCN